MPSARTKFFFTPGMTPERIAVVNNTAFGRRSWERSDKSMRHKEFFNQVPGWVGKALDLAVKKRPVLNPKQLEKYRRDADTIRTMLKVLEFPEDLKSVYRAIREGARLREMPVHERARMYDHFNRTVFRFLEKRLGARDAQFVSWTITNQGHIKFSVNDKFLFLSHFAEQERILK